MTQPSCGPVAPARRDFIKKAGVMGAATLLTSADSGGAWAASSDAPEKKEVKIGFIPLSDCASVVIASVLGFDQKYGVKTIPSKKSS